MKDNSVKDKSFQFALRVIKLYKYLCEEKRELVISKQILRSGTSIGALVEESLQAESKADFIHKLSIANKEANESDYWLRLLKESGYLEDNHFDSIIADLKVIIRLLTSIIISTKKNQKEKRKPK